MTTIKRHIYEQKRKEMLRSSSPPSRPKEGKKEKGERKSAIHSLDRKVQPPEHSILILIN